MHLKITKNLDDLSQQVAGWMVTYIEKILKTKNRFTIVLSGGSTPKNLYQLLASDKYKNKIDWSKLYFFWGDERYVPFTDERNNAKMAFEILLNHVPVLKEQIHVMRTDIDHESSAKGYEKLLHQYFPESNHTFDLVLLGMGSNAHTLSLFPGYPIINEEKDWVKSFYLKEENINRITLTAPVVNASACIIFLISGSDKASALQHVLKEKFNPNLYPAQIIHPYNNELYWWVDEAAAKNL